MVEINTGCIGMVMEVNKAAPTRPVIRIMVNNSGRQLKRTRLIDLSKSTTVMIVRALNDEDVDN